MGGHLHAEASTAVIPRSPHGGFHVGRLSLPRASQRTPGASPFHTETQLWEAAGHPGGKPWRTFEFDGKSVSFTFTRILDLDTGDWSETSVFEGMLVGVNEIWGEYVREDWRAFPTVFRPTLPTSHRRPGVSPTAHAYAETFRSSLRPWRRRRACSRQSRRPDVSPTSAFARNALVSATRLPVSSTCSAREI